jgi:hypothetical protein
MEQPEWTEAWASGQVMSLAESVEFALGEQAHGGVEE